MFVNIDFLFVIDLLFSLFLGELELLMDRANDLCQFRINAVLFEMSTTTLCELPEDEPWTIEQFLQNTQVNKL